MILKVKIENVVVGETTSHHARLESEDGRGTRGGGSDTLQHVATRFSYNIGDATPVKRKWYEEKELFQEWLKTAPKAVKYRVEYQDPVSAHNSEFSWEEKGEFFLDTDEGFKKEELFVTIHMGIRGWYIDKVSTTGVFEFIKHEKFSKHGYKSIELEHPHDKEEYNNYLEQIERDLVDILGSEPDNRYSVLDWSM